MWPVNAEKAARHTPLPGPPCSFHVASKDNPTPPFLASLRAKAAYPEAYAGLDLKALADEVFVLFNGVPLYEEMVRITGPVGRLHLTDKGLAHAAP